MEKLFYNKYEPNMNFSLLGLKTLAEEVARGKFFWNTKIIVMSEILKHEVQVNIYEIDVKKPLFKP